jgi:hypothetical protein
MYRFVMACVQTPSTLLRAGFRDRTLQAALSNLHLFGCVSFSCRRANDLSMVSMGTCLIILVHLDRKSATAHKFISIICTLTGLQILRHSPDPYISMIVAGWMIVSTLAQPYQNMMGSVRSFKSSEVSDRFVIVCLQTHFNDRHSQFELLVIRSGVRVYVQIGLAMLSAVLCGCVPPFLDILGSSTILLY